MKVEPFSSNGSPTDVYYESINREPKIVVYYETMKRKLLKPIYECRCNERLQTKKFMCLTHTGLVVELENLQIKRKFNKREFCECEVVYYESMKRKVIV